jgi:membrane-bound lytic murein transglycosylase B
MTRALIHLPLLLAALVALLPARANEATPPGFDLSRDDIKSFVAEVSQRHSIDREEIWALIGKAQPQPKIIELMTRPAERVSPWYEYRRRFLTKERIDLGVKFFQEHRDVLERISSERGVPPEYLVAIIGVETFYGRVMGRFRVLDALTTLAFDYPPRSRFFRSELEQFVLLTREHGFDPLKVMGSYAGAMGAPQFMPSSYRRYAVDGGNDQKRNLWDDWDDVIASVANYFREHGWETGGPVLVEARLDPDAPFKIDPGNIELNETLDSLSANGVQIDIAAPGNTPVVLISAEQEDGPAYRVGFRNFHVITRYNRSARYAMAVHDLASAIAERVRRSPS